MPRAEKGFTLIELLVVVSIIALLSTVVMTSVNGNRRRALDVSFQSTAKSIQQAAGVCCAAGNGHLQDDLGADICSPTAGGLYPDSANLGAVNIIRDCDDSSGYFIRLEPGNTNSGTIDYAECDNDSCVFTYL